MKSIEEITKEYYQHITDYFKNEEWRFINGYPKYQVSDYGRVRRIPGKGSPHGRIQSPQKHVLGYLFATVRDDNKIPKVKTIHGLVAEAFMTKPEDESLNLNFINENKYDCRPSNLRYVSQSVAMLNGSVQQRRTSKIKKGVNQIDPKTLKVVKYFDSSVDAEMGSDGLFDRWGVRQACRGIITLHAGYMWEYVEVNNG